MADVTVLAIDEREPIYEGLARRARASLGVSSFAMQVMTLPPGSEGYPDHVHDYTVEDANQEEVYIPLHSSATPIAGEARHELRPGVMVRVGPEQRRRILPDPDGLRRIALGGVPGTFRASPWTELGGPLPVPAKAVSDERDGSASV
jgi:hypothetical protein